MTKDEHAALTLKKRDAVVTAASHWYSHQYATGGTPMHLAMATIALCEAVNDLQTSLVDYARFEKYGWDEEKR